MCPLCRFADGHRHHAGTWPQPPGLQVPGWGSCVPLSPLQFSTAPAAGLDVSGVCGDVPGWVTLLRLVLKACLTDLALKDSHLSVYRRLWKKALSFC